MARYDGQRLLLALALSAVLHLSLIYGVAVGGSKSGPPSMIVARLMSQVDTPPAVTSATAGNRRGRSGAAPRFVSSYAEPAFVGIGDVLDEPRPEQVVASVRPDESRLPSADVPLLVDPVWYEAKDLDLYPQPLTAVQPAYPSSATGITGNVTLLLKIDEFGVVEQLSVVTAEPAGYFEDAALHAFEPARFAPAQREGRPVRSRILIKVRFAPQTEEGADVR